MRWVWRIPRLRGLLARAQSVLFYLVYRNHLSGVPNLFGWPDVRLARGSRLRVGRGLVMISNGEFSEWGLNHACQIRTVSPSAEVVIGEDVGMCGATIVCSESVVIGDRVMLGANCAITDTDSHPIDVPRRRFRRDGVRTAPVRIEDDVLIGANSIVLKGVTIGARSVIGAGSVVTKSVPAGTVCAGNPARVLRSLRMGESERDCG